MKKRVFLVVLISFVLTLFVSCSNYTDYDFSGAEKLSIDDLNALEKQICETTAPRYPEITAEDGSTICFWTDGGTVYHRSENCTRLKNSSNVKSGAIESAVSLGKEKECATCFK